MWHSEIKLCHLSNKLFYFLIFFCLLYTGIFGFMEYLQVDGHNFCWKIRQWLSPWSSLSSLLKWNVSIENLIKWFFNLHYGVLSFTLSFYCNSQLYRSKFLFKQRKGIKVSRFIIPISHLVVNVWKQYDCMKFNKGIIHNIIKDIHALPHVLAITSLKFECQRKSLLCQDVGSKGTADQDVLLP